MALIYAVTGGQDDNVRETGSAPSCPASITLLYEYTRPSVPLLPPLLFNYRRWMGRCYGPFVTLTGGWCK